jgi:hypothetical protein
LDSKLLEDISTLGNSGAYAFIPDGSFVGTIFVNAISTLLTTAATNVQVIIMFETTVTIIIQERLKLEWNFEL